MSVVPLCNTCHPGQQHQFHTRRQGKPLPADKWKTNTGSLPASARTIYACSVLSALWVTHLRATATLSLQSEGFLGTGTSSTVCCVGLKWPE